MPELGDGSHRKAPEFTTESDDSIGYENTELFSFLELILTKSESRALRDVDDANVRKLMRNGVRKVTCAFEQNWVDLVVGEDVFQPRISFLTPPRPRRRSKV